MFDEDEDRIDRGPFRGWHEGDVGCFVVAVILVIVLCCLAR